MQKIKPTTSQDWAKCHKFNRQIVDEFIDNSPHLSPYSKKVYRSNLMLWFNWVRLNLDNKPQYEIKPLEFLRFQNYLLNLGHSSADVNNKRAVVSSLCNYIEKNYRRQYPDFRTCVAKGMSKPEVKLVHEKVPLTEEEVTSLIRQLEDREDWQKVAYLRYTYDTGCRRSESVQLLREVVDYAPSYIDGKVIYHSNWTRCKGKGVEGEMKRFDFTEETYDAIKRWLEFRGDDQCPYIFISGRGVTAKQLSTSALNKWATNVFSPILGRRFYPHILSEAKLANDEAE